MATTKRRSKKAEPKPDDGLMFMNVGAAYVIVGPTGNITATADTHLLGGHAFWTSFNAARAALIRIGKPEFQILKLHVISEES